MLYNGWKITYNLALNTWEVGILRESKMNRFSIKEDAIQWTQNHIFTFEPHIIYQKNKEYIFGNINWCGYITIKDGLNSFRFFYKKKSSIHEIKLSLTDLGAIDCDTELSDDLEEEIYTVGEEMKASRAKIIVCIKSALAYAKSIIENESSFEDIYQKSLKCKQ